MEYKDFFNEGQNVEPDGDNMPESRAEQSTTQSAPQAPESRVEQNVAQSTQQTPDAHAAQSTTQSAPPAPEPRVPQEHVRPRVYGQVGQGAAPSGNTGYYSAPNPSYQNNIPPHQGNVPPRPEPRPFGSGADVHEGADAYMGAQANTGGTPSGHPEPNPRIYAPFTPVQPSATGVSGNTKTHFVDRKRFTVLVILIIVAMLASGVSGALIATNINKGGASGVAAGSGSAPSYTIKPNSDANIAEAVAQKVLDSVVGITSKVTTSGGNAFGFDLGQQESGGVGTGMIVDERGYILTNSHVVLDGQLDTLDILLSDGTTIPGKLLWNDKSVDLAIVKIDPAGKTLKAVELGDSDKVNIGQYAAAIGNPLGLDFNSSITQGIVSGLGRSITATDGTTATTMEDLIQVDAAINSGNSGGPLLDKEGNVIGVNTAKAQAEGMGFAIPINTAKPIIDKVIKTGSFERVYMGVSAADAGTIAEQYANLKIDKNLKGAFITAVSGDSPANKAGLKMKDTITKINDKAITSSSDLIKTLLNYSAGDTVKVTYVRDGKEAVTDVKLANQEEVYGEWNNTDSNGGTSPEGSGGNGQIPVDPYGEGSEPTDPFGDW